MKTSIPIATALLLALSGLTHASAFGDKIAVVAAENFYGDVARQLGGDRVVVTSIMSNPDQDPHLFETTPSVIRGIAAAQVVVYNGAGYDAWMEKILAATPKPGRDVIVAADLMHKKLGDNPHLSYDPATMPAVAGALTAAFAAADPAHQDEYAGRLKTFLASLEPLDQKIADIRKRFSGVAVTASEPVFGYMAAALQLKMHNEDFQLAIMNDTEPGVRNIAAFEHDLMTHQVQVMFYNKQASDSLVLHIVGLARADKVPVVAVTETCPPGLSFQDWMMTELEATETALGGPNS